MIALRTRSSQRDTAADHEHRARSFKASEGLPDREELRPGRGLPSVSPSSDLHRWLRAFRYHPPSLDHVISSRDLRHTFRDEMFRRGSSVRSRSGVSHWALSPPTPVLCDSALGVPMVREIDQERADLREDYP